MSSIFDKFVHVPELQIIRATCRGCGASNAVMRNDMGIRPGLKCCGCRQRLWSDHTHGVFRIMIDTGQGLGEMYEALVALEGR